MYFITKNPGNIFIAIFIHLRPWIFTTQLSSNEVTLILTQAMIKRSKLSWVKLVTIFLVLFSSLIKVSMEPNMYCHKLKYGVPHLTLFLESVKNRAKKIIAKISSEKQLPNINSKPQSSSREFFEGHVYCMILKVIHELC